LNAILLLIGLVSALAILYGLHRLGLYLESRDLLYYWHKKPSGGSAYNPLLEIYQPQIQHVIQVKEQRLKEDFGGDAGPEAPR
jgi:hypothetical protein